MPDTLGEKTEERPGLDHLSASMGSGRLGYVTTKDSW